MDPVYVVGLFAAGIGGLWFALNQSHKTQLADKDAQLTEVRKERDDARAEAKAMNDVLGRNTDALEESNQNTRIMIELYRRTNQGESGKAWTNSMPDPELPEPR